MTDRAIVEKISGYILRIKRIYELIEPLEKQEILALDDSFALTQFMTNILSLFENITNNDIAKKLFDVGIWYFTCTYDYDALDWVKVKQLCKRLLSETSEKLLQECYEISEKQEGIS